MFCQVCRPDPSVFPQLLVLPQRSGGRFRSYRSTAAFPRSEAEGERLNSLVFTQRSGVKIQCSELLCLLIVFLRYLCNSLDEFCLTFSIRNSIILKSNRRRHFDFFVFFCSFWMFDEIISEKQPFPMFNK